MRLIPNFIFVSLLIVLGLASLTDNAYAISFDSTFGLNGKVITEYGHESYISKTVIQTDGKIISVGGASNGSNLDWAMARYYSDGSLDTSFGNGGKVYMDFGGDDALASIKVQSDGKIIVGGFSHTTANFQWTLARFDSNGLIDKSFGINDNGIVTTFLGIHSVMNSIALLPDGKIIAIGYRQEQGQDDVAIARYNANGTLDNTFGGGDGIVTTPIGGSNDRGIAAALQNDGKIIVFGDYNAGSQDKIFLVRYDSNGTPDNSFGSGGKVTTRIGTYDGSRAIAIQTDGKIVVAGTTNMNTSSDTYIARYNSSGSLDTTFGTNGITIKSFTTGNDGANSLILQPDGKIILGGFENVGGASGNDFALRQFNNDGTLDTEFGSGGSFVTPIGSGNDSINSIALQNDGNIIAAGSVSNGNYNDWGLARYSMPPLPFLDLPWDYKVSGKGFIQQAFNPESWFDHEYPLQDVGCCVQNALMYDGIERKVAYRSHSGYDYARRNGIDYQTSVLAAAEGTATFIPETISEGYGNLIKIDHGNGYQTWYGHLDPLNNIFATGAAELHVNKGDKIGEVGFTGNIFPKNKYGAHIHFSVFKDINSKNKFNDDYPYGLVDPLGWKPSLKYAAKIDPWTLYTNNVSSGAASFNLFIERTPPVRQFIKKEDGGIIVEDKTTISIPQETFPVDVVVELDKGPFESDMTSDLISLVPSVILTAKSLLGDLIEIFSLPVQISYNYSEADLTNIDQESIKLFRFNSDTGKWEPLTMVSHDQASKIITAETKHFSRFALMGKTKDTLAPTTEIVIQGEMGKDSWYHSAISAELKAKDNEGGLGVKDTIYTLNGTNWFDYTEPLTIEDEGKYTITYQSRDNANNIEDQKSLTFHIDRKAPEAQIVYDLSKYDIVVTGKDTAGETSIIVDKSSQLHPKYTISDQAGNTLMLNTDKIKVGKQITFNIKTLRYNTGPVIQLDKNMYFTSVLTDKKNTVKQLDQFYSLKGDKKIFTNYSDDAKATKIYTKNSGGKFIRENKQGIALLQLYTQNGALKYRY